MDGEMYEQTHLDGTRGMEPEISCPVPDFGSKMSSGSDDKLPEWVKTFSSPPIKGKTVAKRRALIVDSDEEDVEPAPPPASVPAKNAEVQAGEAIALDPCPGARH